MTRQEELSVQRRMLTTVMREDRVLEEPSTLVDELVRERSGASELVARQGVGELEQAGAIVVEGDRVRPSDCVRWLRALRVLP